MNGFKRASLLLEKFKNRDSGLNSILKSIYGNDDVMIDKKVEKYIVLLSAFLKKYGDRDVIISRAPGRVNLMGRHVEHRGGNVNTIAIHKETIMVASKREDDVISISNVDEKFTDFSFSLVEERGKSNSDVWLDYIEDSNVKESVANNRGHWSNYVKGSALRFMFEFDTPFVGMDIMCLGTVPIAGGLSSSSSIVVSTAELVCAMNNIAVEKEEFISLCGQSEWYVGSRGGAGDHAAIKCGEPGSVTPIEFEPIKVLEAVKVPDKYSVIVANSFIEAKKSEGAKDRFNQMVAAYEFGVMLVLKEYPQFRDKIKHLRDINPQTLGVSETTIYKMLKKVPLWIKPEELFELIPSEFHEKVKRIISSHVAPKAYNLRSALFYGITECERSRKSSSLILAGDIENFAGIMNISHCGDRVAILTDDGVKDYDYLFTDDKIDVLIEKSNNNDDQASLYKQPGGYACSVEQIDVLIDKLLKKEGVLGAQISGAGLGGCIMILCEKECESSIMNFLRDEYYKPNNYPDGAIVVKPIKGSMCIAF